MSCASDNQRQASSALPRAPAAEVTTVVASRGPGDDDLRAALRALVQDANANSAKTLGQSGRRLTLAPPLVARRQKIGQRIDAANSTAPVAVSRRKAGAVDGPIGPR